MIVRPWHICRATTFSLLTAFTMVTLHDQDDGKTPHVDPSRVAAPEHRIRHVSEVVRHGCVATCQ